MIHLENTHFLRKGKYHCTADLLFDRLGFGQTSKSVDSLCTLANWPRNHGLKSMNQSEAIERAEIVKFVCFFNCRAFVN